MSDLKITVHEWSAEEKANNEAFYAALRGFWDKLVPWYKLAEPFSAAGAQKFTDMMKYGNDEGWAAPKRLDDIAVNIPVPSSSGAEGLYLRVFRPPGASDSTNGVYLHFHGGGWTVGAADVEDETLYRIAKETNHVVASFEYRMGPKYKFPVPIEDCIDAAHFLLEEENEAKYGPLRIIGGESAGAHLSMTVTFALRDEGLDVRKQLDCLVLNYGCYDLTHTPSARTWQDNLVLSTTDMANFADSWLSEVPDRRIPEISPLYNRDFSHMPPAIFVIGSNDPLYDDSLFGAVKWRIGGNDTQLTVFPGSYHGLCRLGGPDKDAGLKASETFVKQHVRKSRS